MKSDKVLIVGKHPLLRDIVRQFEERGAEVCCLASFSESGLPAERWNDIVLLTSPGTNSSATDEQAVRWLQAYADGLAVHPGTPESGRPKVHLLLQSQENLFNLNTREYSDEWHQKFELFPFTIEDVWAKRVVSGTCCRSVTTGSEKDVAPLFGKPLDYIPISLESQHVVHLVVFGASMQTMALAENAALVAHYPNYIRDHSLRTRITIVDKDIAPWRAMFVSRHRALMDNSFHRYIDIHNQSSETSRPMYEDREDFVDVEWEFVKGSVHDTVVHDKLLAWASDDRQVLTVAICHDDDERNVSLMRVVSDLLVGFSVPVYVRQRSATMLSLITRSPRLMNVVPFGMLDSGYDVSLPLLRMAKRVKYVYDYCYDHNIASATEGCITAPSHIDDEEVEAHWLTERGAIKRYSCLCNALTISTKMRSIGHGQTDLSTFYAISSQEIDLIGQVEHNRWNVEEMLLGYRPCTDEEQQEIEADIAKKGEYKRRLVHYDLRAYADLRADGTGKNVNTYDLCLSAAIPLIAFASHTDDSRTETKGGKA